MAGRRLLLSMFLGTVLFTGKAGAWDVFNVYAAKRRKDVWIKILL